MEHTLRVLKSVNRMCEYTAWFEVSGRPRLCFGDTTRLEYLCTSLARPTQQYPSVITFVGSKAKSLALSRLYASFRARRTGDLETNHANIYTDDSTVNDAHPLFFVDANLAVPIPEHAPSYNCHRSSRTVARWETNPTDLHEVLFPRLIFLFSDIICLFADDFGTLEQTVAQVARWINEGSASTLPIAVRPKVLIITSTDRAVGLPTQPSPLIIESLHLDSVVSDRTARACFSSLEIIRLVRHKKTGALQYAPLERYLR